MPWKTAKPAKLTMPSKEEFLIIGGVAVVAAIIIVVFAATH